MKKRINITAYREEYERNIERVKSRRGRYMKGKRQSTVEPVFDTLKEFMGLRKVNTIGIRQANRCMHLAAIAYNLKKYLKSTTKKIKAGANALQRSPNSPSFFINTELLAFQAVLWPLFSGSGLLVQKQDLLKKS